MNAIIIDDEPIAREGIEILSDQIPYLNIVGSYGNPLQAQEHILTSDGLDLIFLDIEMPGITGIDYLRSMPPKCNVILTTAYPQYALDAFELDVVDYLLKPIRLDRFAKAVQKVKELVEMQHHDLEISDDHDIYIKADRKYIKLSLDEILYIKGLKDYVIIYTKDDKYMTAMNVSTIGKQLPSDMYCRVSKSYIVNVNYITSINTDSIDINGNEIPLGRTYKENLMSNHVYTKLLRR